MKRLLKVFLISSIVALLCMAFAVLASAEESYTLTYFHGDSAKNKEIYNFKQRDSGSTKGRYLQ